MNSHPARPTFPLGNQLAEHLADLLNPNWFYAVICETELGTLEWCGIATINELSTLVFDDLMIRLNLLEMGEEPAPVARWVVFNRDAAPNSPDCHPVCWIQP